MLAQGVAADGPRTARRALAVDLGERRVGLAISDAAGRFALPLAVLARESDRQVIGEIRTLAATHEVALLVVGEPLAPDGVRGPAAERARRFGERLARATARPVRFVDETLTSVAAAELLAARPATGRRDGRSGRSSRPIDAVAAQVILQEAIDRGLLEDGA
jgi:putative Holliday junction resolvase